MFSELCESDRRNEERKRVNIDPCKHIFFDVIKEYPGRVDPITSEWRLSGGSNGIRGASVSSHSTSRSVEVEDGQLATTTCTALATIEGEYLAWRETSSRRQQMSQCGPMNGKRQIPKLVRQKTSLNGSGIAAQKWNTIIGLQNGER